MTGPAYSSQKAQAWWLEVFKKDGEWKIMNHKGTIIATEPTKARALDTARFKLGKGTDGVYYIGAQVYNADGTRGQQLVGNNGSKAAERWIRKNARRRSPSE